jgi:ribosome-associated protein
MKAVGRPVDDLAINESLVIPARELRVAFARSGGPGGQNVNKVETKAELRWTPGESAAFSEADRAWLLRRLASRLTAQGELLVTSTRTRDQSRNRDDAREKMAEIVRQALQRPKRRKKTRPGKRAIEGRLQEKRRRSDAKQKRQSPQGSSEWS